MLAKRLFDFYPPQEAGNPEVVLAGVVELFENYPPEIVARAASPVFGLPRTHKFMPRIAEIAEFLEAQMGPADRARIRAALPEPQIDRSERLNYDELCAKYGGDGRGDWGLEKEKPKIDPFPTISQLKEIAGNNWDDIPAGRIGSWKKLDR